MVYRGTVEDIVPGSVWVYFSSANTSCRCPTWEIMTSSTYVVDSVNTERIGYHNRRGTIGSSYTDTPEAFLKEMILRPSNQQVAMIRLKTLLSMIKGSEGISQLEVYSIVDERDL